MDSCSTGRGCWSDVLSHRGGATGFLRGSVGHRQCQRMGEVKEETSPLNDSQLQTDAVSQLNLVTCELREDLEHEMNGRMYLVDIVKCLRSEREKDE